MGIHFPIDGLGITREEADSSPNWLRGGVSVGRRVSQAVEGFVTSLAGGFHGLGLTPPRLEVRSPTPSAGLRFVC